MERVTAVFENQAQAEQAVAALRGMGVNDAHLSFISRHAGDSATDGADVPDVGDGAGKGLLAGAGVGAIFGLAAAMIPGVGPFITAGWLASALGAAAAVSRAVAPSRTAMPCFTAAPSALSPINDLWSRKVRFRFRRDSQFFAFGAISACLVPRKLPPGSSRATSPA